MQTQSIIDLPFLVGFDLVHSASLFRYLNFSALSFSGLFTNHPFPYVRPAMEQFDATFLAGIQKANDLGIYERYALVIQHDGRLFAINLHFQFMEMLRLQPTA